MSENRCAVCDAEKHHGVSTCAHCKRILDRVETRRDASGTLRRADHAARLRAMRESWRDGAFHCYYTGVALIDDTRRFRDHRYLVFENRIPGDEASVVVTCALISRMKTNLTDRQFQDMVRELARTFDHGGPFDERAFPDGPPSA